MCATLDPVVRGGARCVRVSSHVRVGGGLPHTWMDDGWGARLACVLSTPRQARSRIISWKPPGVCAILGPVIRRRARCARVPSLGYSPHASIDASPLALSHSRPHPRMAPTPPSKRTAPKPKVDRLSPGVPSSELRWVGGGGGDGDGGDGGGGGGGGD